MNRSRLVADDKTAGPGRSTVEPVRPTGGRGRVIAGPGLGCLVDGFSPDAILRLQATIGNAAVSRMLLQSPRPSMPSQPVVRRMPDPSGDVLSVLQGTYAKYYKTYSSHGLPTPSKLRGVMVSSIADADDQDGAFQAFAEHVSGLFFGDRKFKRARKVELKEALDKFATSTSTKRKERSDELTRLREAKVDAPKKKRRLDGEGGAVPVYDEVQKADVKSRLANKKMENKLFYASTLGYRKHRSRGRKDVAKASNLNALPTVGHLHTADLAQAQDSYVQSRHGDALILETVGDAQVTMARSGGQEVHHLGPYLPGSKTSVQELLENILATKKVTSPELAGAISMSSADLTEAFLKFKGVPEHFLVKVRAMRHLLTIEMDRGPETAVGTSLEHRSSLHGYRDIRDYPRYTPLGPPKATTELRKAREDATPIAEEGAPMSFTYIPPETRSRTLVSITHFVTNFVDAPTEDPEATHFINAFLNEPEGSDMPTDDFVDACADVLRTPMYNPFEEFVEQEEETDDLSMNS